jgi:hypothetical protein
MRKDMFYGVSSAKAFIAIGATKLNRLEAMPSAPKHE